MAKECKGNDSCCWQDVWLSESKSVLGTWSVGNFTETTWRMKQKLNNVQVRNGECAA